ncbi:MAG TPA: prepilin-type N-terminal cleavage/methylation domain-containing protein [Terriglobales bacterium]|nr:prepilin-type N-terminal cleavage/methylation domain-containing protein [Terriglobales bacterium]
MKKTAKGFSLIELLIVVAIILIIAAIAIPNLLRSRIAANEASAVGSVRTINTAEVTYNSTYPDCGFTTLNNLGGSGGNTTGAGLLDAVLANGTKSGYSFGSTASGGGTGCGTGTGTPNTTYTVNGSPLNAQTGQRYFFSDQSGVIRYNNSTTATATDAPLQ